MSESRFDDHELDLLAARLAPLAPRLPAHESQELLFRCGFAAGRTAAARQARRWQALSAALAVLLLGLSIPLVQQRFPLAWRAPAAIPEQAPAPRDFAQTAMAVAAIKLDAWQQPAQATAALEQDLARFGQTEESLRLLSAGMLSQSLLE
jgi:hypothetical protein